jgi:uncharacterized membrane protein YkgB
MKRLFDHNMALSLFNAVDSAITRWMARYGLAVLRIGLGIVFFWFGALKLFPGQSPAEELVRNTVYFVDPDLFIPVLAVWEMAIGLGLIFNLFMRLTLLLLFLQMPGTALPLLILPDAVWVRFPFVLTIEGQYIIKNLVLIGAGLVLGGTVRGGRVEPEPEPEPETPRVAEINN